MCACKDVDCFLLKYKTHKAICLFEKKQYSKPQGFLIIFFLNKQDLFYFLKNFFILLIILLSIFLFLNII